MSVHILNGIVLAVSEHLLSLDPPTSRRPEAAPLRQIRCLCPRQQTWAGAESAGVVGEIAQAVPQNLPQSRPLIGPARPTPTEACANRVGDLARATSSR